jgi:hypothetical protein
MKVDYTAFLISSGVLVYISMMLFCIRKRLLRIFLSIFIGFIVLEFLLPFLGIGQGLWWCIHLPSVIILGVDETLERHGVFISTFFHFADLILWSAILMIPVALKLKEMKKEKKDLPDIKECSPVDEGDINEH